MAKAYSYMVYGLQTDLQKKWRKIMSWNVVVDNDKCTGCGECVDICPVEVYELKDAKSSVVNEEECLGCESCVEVCEFDAITVEEV